MMLSAAVLYERHHTIYYPPCVELCGTTVHYYLVSHEKHHSCFRVSLPYVHASDRVHRGLLLVEAGRQASSEDNDGV